MSEKKAEDDVFLLPMSPSQLILALNERDIPYFPIKCPKCGVVHILVIFGLPWNESIKEKTT